MTKSSNKRIGLIDWKEDRTSQGEQIQQQQQQQQQSSPHCCCCCCCSADNKTQVLHITDSSLCQVTSSPDPDSHHTPNQPWLSSHSQSDLTLDWLVKSAKLPQTTISNPKPPPVPDWSQLWTWMSYWLNRTQPHACLLILFFYYYHTTFILFYFCTTSFIYLFC